MSGSLISIVVPAYNRADLVRRCYESVVAQTYRPLEFLLVDDDSTDNTAEAVAGLQAAEQVRVVYIKQPKNQGVSAARNAGVRQAQGRVIAFLDSDDVWFPQHLEKMVKKMGETSADVVFARAEIRESPDAPKSGRSNFGPTQLEEQRIHECLYYYNFVLPSVTIVNRDFFDRVGFFDEEPDIQHAEDWDIFVRAAKAGLVFAHLREVTGYYIVPAQVPEKKRLMMMRRSLFCLEKHSDYPFASEARKRFTRGYYLLLLGITLGYECNEAKEAFYKAWRESWFSPLIGPPSMIGMLLGRMPVGALSYGRRAIARLFRRVRAKHRTWRGFPDPWD